MVSDIIRLFCDVILKYKGRPFLKIYIEKLLRIDFMQKGVVQNFIIYYYNNKQTKNPKLSLRVFLLFRY